MQTRPVAQLARKIRATQRRTNSYRVAAAQLHILKSDGEPNPGLAYDIAHNGYMPSQDLIDRLIYDGAIDRPRPRPLELDPKQRRAILLALRERKPLPPPTARTVREFCEWLDTRQRRRARAAR